MALEEALQAQEDKVDGLLRTANRYVSALKGWKKACEVGHIGNMQKAAAQSDEIIASLPEASIEARIAWQFDVRGYLDSEEWRTELMAVAADKYSLRTSLDEDTVISSPVVVRSQPARNSLALGKTAWPMIRPKVVAAHLKSLRDRTASANSQEFVESLFGACRHLGTADNIYARFRDIYDLFCLTPGYKKENPPAAFSQQIYALHRSEVRTTRGGRKFEIEYATGNAKDRDIFAVVSEDGQRLKYYNIWFK